MHEMHDILVNHWPKWRNTCPVLAYLVPQVLTLTSMGYLFGTFDVTTGGDLAGGAVVWLRAEEAR